jgi:hypothetical protein
MLLAKQWNRHSGSLRLMPPTTASCALTSLYLISSS